jgi:hypothetical protein
LETLYEAEADEERDSSKDAEAAVDETPERRDAAERSGDEGEGKDAGAGDYAELKHPFVADRVAQWAEEDDGQDEVGEGEPVGSISEEGVAKAGVAEGVVDSCDPKDDWVGKDRVGVEVGCEPTGFTFEREGG